MFEKSFRKYVERNQSNHLVHIDGLVQERRNSIANALELLLSCTNPSICFPLPKPIMSKFLIVCHQVEALENVLCHRHPCLFSPKLLLTAVSQSPHLLGKTGTIWLDHNFRCLFEKPNYMQSNSKGNYHKLLLIEANHESLLKNVPLKIDTYSKRYIASMTLFRIWHIWITNGLILIRLWDFCGY